jgi:hypothetical protein
METESRIASQLYFHSRGARLESHSERTNYALD